MRSSSRVFQRGLTSALNPLPGRNPGRAGDPRKGAPRAAIVISGRLLVTLSEKRRPCNVSLRQEESGSDRGGMTTQTGNCAAVTYTDSRSEIGSIAKVPAREAHSERTWKPPVLWRSGNNWIDHIDQTLRN